MTEKPKEGQKSAAKQCQPEESPSDYSELTRKPAKIPWRASASCDQEGKTHSQQPNTTTLRNQAQIVFSSHADTLLPTNEHPLTKSTLLYPKMERKSTSDTASTPLLTTLCHAVPGCQALRSGGEGAENSDRDAPHCTFWLSSI